MNLNEKYAEFLKNKTTFGEYKDMYYPKTFENRLIKFIEENDFKYNEFKNMLSMNFEFKYTPEGLLNLLTAKSVFNNHINNYVTAVGSKFAGIFYLFLEEIPSLHEDTLIGLQQSYRIHEVELEQEFKFKNK